MSEERMEEIKRNFEVMTSEEKEWLIEQVERVQELEEDCEYLSHHYGLEAEKNKRYREAIEFGIEYLKNSDIRQAQLVVRALKKALEGEE